MTCQLLVPTFSRKEIYIRQYQATISTAVPAPCEGSTLIMSHFVLQFPLIRIKMYVANV